MIAMLQLHLKENEYLTIGGDIVVKVQAVGGKHTCLSIEAPREVPIVRGKVLERCGGTRPVCVDASPKK